MGPVTPMFDYHVQRCTRRCASTERELAPNETIYSVLVAEGASLGRYDYCEAAWKEPEAGAIGWWKWKIPAPGARRPSWAPHQAILGFFESLEEQADKQDLRYVLALLMVRRRIARIERTEAGPRQEETLVLYSPHTESEYRVLVVEPPPSRLAEIQSQLEELLVVAGPPSLTTEAGR